MPVERGVRVVVGVGMWGVWGDVLVKWEPRAGGLRGGCGEDGSMQGEGMRWNWPVAAWDTA